MTNLIENHLPAEPLSNNKSLISSNRCGRGWGRTGERLFGGGGVGTCGWRAVIDPAVAALVIGQLAGNKQQTHTGMLASARERRGFRHNLRLKED